MSSNGANRDLQSNGSGRHSPSEAESNSANGSSDDKQNGSSGASCLKTGSPMEVPYISPVKSDESNSSFENVSSSEAVQENTLDAVMKVLRERHYKTENEDHLAESNSRLYYEKDYRCEVITNKLCPNYPANLLIPVALKENGCEKEGSVMDFNKESYTKLVGDAVHCRIRSRYPVPVILFDNKFICRSGTLSNKASAAYNQLVEAKDPATSITTEGASVVGSAVDAVTHFTKCVKTGFTTILSPSELKELFKKDREILDLLKVDHVCDLMTEYAKVYKDFPISSSEILNKDIYRTIENQDLPFPGCEFFKTYSDANRNPEGLKFNFTQNEVTRELVVTDKDLKRLIPDLKEDGLLDCDVIEITKNYLKMMLAFLVKDKGGILVHCISGWDRTPLFISLLRLSLWADGVIHKSLDYKEIAYLTVAYDFYLFGHDFPNRWSKREEIMHFCFNFLSYMTTDEFSVTKMFKRLSAAEKENREFPEYEPGRRVVLNNVRQYFLDAYHEHIIEWEDERDMVVI